MSEDDSQLKDTNGHVDSLVPSSGPGYEANMLTVNAI